MTASKRLSAHRASASAAQADDDTEIPAHEEDQDEEECNDSNPAKDQDMNEDETKAAIETARADGVKAERDRMSAVFASEHYAGRESLAAKILGKDMSAEDIVDLLAATPKIEPATIIVGGEGEGGDAAARAELRKNLAADQPEKTADADDQGSKTEAADTSLVDNMKARFASR